MDAGRGSTLRNPFPTLQLHSPSLSTPLLASCIIPDTLFLFDSPSAPLLRAPFTSLVGHRSLGSDHRAFDIMAQYFFDLLYNFTDCMCCFPSTPQLKINNRSFKLLRLLGEV